MTFEFFNCSAASLSLASASCKIEATASIDPASLTLSVNDCLSDKNFKPLISDTALFFDVFKSSSALLVASSRATFNSMSAIAFVVLSMSALADSISFVKLSTTDCFALTSACNCSTLLFLALSSCCCKSESVAVSVVSFDSSGETLAVSVLICSVKATILFSFSVNEACMFGFATAASDTAVFAFSNSSSESSLSDLAASNDAFRSGFDVSRAAKPSAVSTLMLGYWSEIVAIIWLYANCLASLVDWAVANPFWAVTIFVSDDAMFAFNEAITSFRDSIFFVLESISVLMLSRSVLIAFTFSVWAWTADSNWEMSLFWAAVNADLAASRSDCAAVDFDCKSESFAFWDANVSFNFSNSVLFGDGLVLELSDPLFPFGFVGLLGLTLVDVDPFIPELAPLFDDPAAELESLTVVFPFATVAWADSLAATVALADPVSLAFSDWSSFVFSVLTTGLFGSTLYTLSAFPSWSLIVIVASDPCPSIWIVFPAKMRSLFSIELIWARRSWLTLIAAEIADNVSPHWILYDCDVPDLSKSALISCTVRAVHCPSSCDACAVVAGIFKPNPSANIDVRITSHPLWDLTILNRVISST